MRRAWLGGVAVVALACATGSMAAEAAPASAFNPIKTACSVAGEFSGLAGKACTVAEHGDQLLKAGKKLLGGHVGSAVKTAIGGGSGSSSSTASTALGLAAIGAWVMGGAKFALDETAKVLGRTTSPQLTTTWFSSAYWRIAEIATVLTLPFLFAAAVQALMRSDLALLVRAAFGYLPLAFLAVSIAAPIAMLLLAASDQMSSVVSKAAGHGGEHFLALSVAAAGLLSLLHRTAFLAFVVGLFTVAGAVVLWAELLAREAAVYIVVLLLPLAFAAMVWPARRVWAIRSVELLVALILCKFAIVAVLTLGSAALGHTSGSAVTSTLAGFVLVVLAIFAPWALMRLLPLTELAGHAMASLNADGRMALGQFETAVDKGAKASDWLALATEMSRELPAAEPPIQTDSTSESDPTSGHAGPTVTGDGTSEGGDAAAGAGTPNGAALPDGPELDGAASAEPGLDGPASQPARASEGDGGASGDLGADEEARPGGAQPGPKQPYEAPDLTLPYLTAETGEGWPAPRDSSAPRDSPAPADSPAPPDSPAPSEAPTPPDAQAPPTTSDDPDPRPPTQDPDQGSL